MSIEKILLIAHDPDTTKTLKEYFSAQELHIALSSLEGIECIKESSFDVILCDLELHSISGMDVVKIAKTLCPNTPIIVLTADTKMDKALSAIRLGAFHYLLKPISSDAIDACMQKAKEHILLLQENEFLRKEISYPLKQAKTPIIAKSLSMKQILKDVATIAQSNASVFIIGESGTGKEVIANAIHEQSLRSQKPFIRVNCAAIADSLLESEFFGHEKGSFTGAIQKRIGRFELADQGTLLLDEISEVPLELQPKLLRAIQEQEFERVGGIKPIHVDVRLISTSNRNMMEAIEKKIFREDLFFRLHVIPIQIPPLRDRKEDILPLAEYFLDKSCKDNAKQAKILSKEAEEKLLSYYWPGNVRELANIMERTIVMHIGDKIHADDLKLEFSCPVPSRSSWTSPGHTHTLASVEKNHILSTLQALGNNKTHAAKNLGISLRPLRNKLKSYT
jgi:two-component system, NtrC family, response regulator AtoC